MSRDFSVFNYRLLTSRPLFTSFHSMTHYGEFNDLFSTRQEIIYEGIGRIRPSGDDDGDIRDGGDVGDDDEYSDDLVGGGGDDGGESGDDDGGGDDSGDDDGRPKFVSSYADQQRVSAGGTADNRFRTPAERAKIKLTAVFDSDYFSSSDTRLVMKLVNAFGERLPTLNLHVLAATATWMESDHPSTEKALGDWCKAKRVDPADLLRYQTIIGDRLRAKSKASKEGEEQEEE